MSLGSKSGLSLKINKNLETLRNDSSLKDAPLSLESPKIKSFGEGSAHNKTPKTGEYYTAASVSKLKRNTSKVVKEPESSSTFRDSSSVQNESRATASVSIPRSSTINEPKWEQLVIYSYIGESLINVL